MKKNAYPLVFFLTTLFIMWDLLKPGYILTIDMGYGPLSPYLDLINHWQGKGSNLTITGGSPLVAIGYYAVSYLFSLIAPAWLVQKASILILIALSGIIMFRVAPTQNLYGRYFAGFLYMVNPFTYVRWLTGSFWLLWSYAFLPLAVKSFIDLLEKPNIKNVLLSSLWLTLIAPSVHLLLMAWGIFALLLLLNLSKREVKRLSLIGIFLAVIALFGALNLSWLSSVLSGQSLTMQTLRSLGPQDLEAFATSADGNVFLNAVSLYGFWRGGYYDPKDHLGGWQFLLVFLLFFAIYGFIVGWDKKNSLYVKGMGLIAVAAVILTIGVSQEQLGDFFRLLSRNVPFFAGFRDSQKFAALLALSYAYLGSLGVAEVMDVIRKSKSRAKLLPLLMGILLLVVPLLYSYSMFFGFWGQLKNVDYPSDYYEVNSFLQKDQEEFQVLFLPWHQSMYFTWVGAKVANPAESFFVKPVIRGDNIEMGDIYTQSSNPVSKYIESLLSRKDKINNWGEFLAPLKVKYIIIAKEVDWEGYLFLKNQRDLQLIRDTPHLLVFSNKSYPAETSQIKKQAQFLDWDAKAVDNLERSIMQFEKVPGRGIGYILSLSLFTGMVAHLIWRRKGSLAGAGQDR